MFRNLGGHVNLFDSAADLEKMLAWYLGLPHVATRTLFTSLSFLNRKNTRDPSARAQMRFPALPERMLAFVSAGTRLVDRCFSTRTRVYGWGFYFGSIREPIDPRPLANVCIRCGQAHPGHALQGAVRRSWLVPSYYCPAPSTFSLPKQHKPQRARRILYMRWKLTALFALAMIASAQMTTDQLVAFVRSSIQRKLDDREVASYLQKVRLSSRLDDATIEQLQTLGAGPKTVVALRDLGNASVKLSAAPPPPAPVATKATPPPSAAAQKKAVADATEYALNYENSLPNFLVTQVTRRYQEAAGTGSWRPLDTINENLSYFDHHENYKVIQVNGKMVEMSHEKLQGAVSSGEFGSIMKAIFAPQTETQFAWDHWGKLRDQSMQVYSYRVELANSNYHIAVHEKSLDIVVAYHGLIFVDNENHFVHRITLQAEGIPANYPVQELSITLDYDSQKIGDVAYLLPLKFDLRSKDERVLVKNDVDYHFYRKFGTDTSIKFDVPEEKPRR